MISNFNAMIHINSIITLSIKILRRKKGMITKSLNEIYALHDSNNIIVISKEFKKKKKTP